MANQPGVDKKIIEYTYNFKVSTTLLLSKLSEISRGTDDTSTKIKAMFKEINAEAKRTDGSIGLIASGLEDLQMGAARFGTNMGGKPLAILPAVYEQFQPQLSAAGAADREVMNQKEILSLRQSQEKVAEEIVKDMSKGSEREAKAAASAEARDKRRADAAERRQIRLQERADRVAKQDYVRVKQQPIMIEVDEAKQALKVEAQRAKVKEDYNKWVQKYRTGQKGELTIEQQQTAEAKKQTAEITNQANIIKMTVAQKKILAMTKYSEQGQGIANLGNDQWMKQVNQTKVLLKQLSAEFKVSSGVAAGWATGMDIDGEIVRQALKEVRQEAKGLAGTLRTTFGNIQNYISTAFGVSLAMLLFKAQMAVSQFFTESLQKAKDFDEAMRELRFTERIMSEAGIEVTNQQLDDMIQRLRDAKVGFSKLTATKLVSEVAMASKSIQGMDVKKLDGLVKSVAYIQSIRPDIAVGTIVNAILDRSDRAINQFIQFNEEVIKFKAYEMGLISNINDEMSEEIKYAAALAILVKGTGDELANYAESIKGTKLEAQRLAAVLLDDIGTNFGQSLYEIDTVFKRLLLDVEPIIKFVQELVSATFILASAGARFAVNAVQYLKLLEAIFSKEGLGGYFKQLWKNMQVDITNAIIGGFKDSQSFVGKFFYDYALKNKQEYIVPEPETATGEPPPSPDDIVNQEAEKASKIEQIKIEMLDKGRELDNRRKDDEADNLKDRLRAQEDYERDKLRLKEDYEHDLEQAQVDSGNKAAEAQADYQNAELEAELKFQEELRQLRQKFLFDLEDALAQRDARQVIRLQKQYAMDVTNKTNENNLEKQQRARDLAEELVQIANDTQSRIAEIEYNYATEKRRMEEDYLLEQQRREQDHAIAMIRLFRDAGIEMLKLAAELSTLLMQQFGTVISAAMQMRSALGVQTASGGNGGISGRSMGSFTPFAGATSGHGNGMSGGLQQGNLQIQVDLSPNLEATIVNNAINGVAEVLTSATNGRR